MAKLRKVGKALVITSEVKADEIKRVEKFAPKALALVNEEKEVTFKVSAGKYSTVGTYGIGFDSKNSEGYAELTMITELADKAAITEEYGVVLSKLNKVEGQIINALEDVNDVFTSVEANIEVE